jgi:Zn finger protein HypA/HybF involved in hydrogenase expression
VPQCPAPACKKEIDYLIYNVTASESGNYNQGGNFHEKNTEYSDHKFYCPECYAELDLDDSGEADKFLAGELPILTKDQQKKYLEHPELCPVCGSDQTEAGKTNFDDGVLMTQEVHCLKCEAKWQDIYTLTEVHAKN